MNKLLFYLISIILCIGVVSAVNSEYILTTPTMTGTNIANYSYATIYNPSIDQALIIRHIQIQAESTAAATYQPITVMRISTANGGTQIATSNISKKNFTSPNSIAEIRYSNVNVTLSNADSRIITMIGPGAAGSLNGYKDVVLDNPIILLPNEGLALYQEAAGSNSAQKIRMEIEWGEQNTTTTPLILKDDYIISTPMVSYASLNSVMASIFNPSTTNKTAIINRIGINVLCNGAAAYDTITLMRITSASDGTLITKTDIPKKNTGENTSVMEVRYNAITASGTGNARIASVTACGAANQVIGHIEYVFNTTEKIILKQGEGIKLYTEGSGDINDLANIFIEWSEVINTSTPAAQNEYIITYPPVAVAATVNYTYDTFFNPVASGKVAIINSIKMRSDANSIGTYQPLTLKKITAASSGTAITAATVPKKNTGTANTLMELRYGGGVGGDINVTPYGTINSRILSMMGAGAVGQLRSNRELTFNNGTQIILLPGEGISLYSEDVGDVNQLVYLSIVWDEEDIALTPAADNQYIINVGPITGSATDDYNYTTLYNPVGSNTTMAINKIYIGIEAIGTAVYTPFSIARITNASGGTQIVASDIIKKNNASINSIAEVLYGPIITPSGGIDARISNVMGAGSVGSATAPQLQGLREIMFNGDLILQPGEGIALYQEGLGDIDQRINLYVEWKEQAYSQTLQSINDRIISIPINGSLTNGFSYSTIFNPSNSSRQYVIKNIGIRGDRNAIGSVPLYIPLSMGRISAASGGTLISSLNIPAKNTLSQTSTAEIRYSPLSVTKIIGNLLSITAPGAVGQAYGIMNSMFLSGEEIVLNPGEGLILYQEATAGDTNISYKMDVEWSENPIITNIFPYPNNYYLNTSAFTINFTTTYKYATIIYNITGITNNSYTNVTTTNSTTHTFSNLPDGKYYYSTIIDTYYYDPNITIDTTYPTINYTVDTETSGSVYHRNNIFINTTVNDTNLNYTIIHIYNYTGSLVSTTIANSVNQTLLADGIYYFNATACDLANNCNSTETRNVTIHSIFDNASYNIIFPYSNNYYLNKNFFNMNFTTTDPYYYYTIYNITGITNSSYTNVTNTTAINYVFNNLLDGKYYYALTIYDLANNNKYYDPNITIDTIYPTINYTNTTAISGDTYNTTGNIFVNVTVNDTNLDYTAIRFYNSTGGLINTTIGTSINFTTLSNGVFYFNATVCDLAVNCNSTETRNITINYYKNNITFTAYQRTTNATIPYNITFTGLVNIFTVASTNRTTSPTNIPSDTYNITVAPTGYYNCTFTNWTAVDNYTFPDCILYNNVLNITAYHSYLGTQVAFTTTLTLGNYTEILNGTQVTYNLIQGQNYTIAFYNTSFVNRTITYVPNALTNTLNQSIDQTQITIYFNHAFTGTLANDTTITINDTTIPGHTYNTTTGILYITPNNGTKNFTMIAGGDTIAQPFNLITAAGEVGNRTILLYPVLSLDIYDEKLSLINQTRFNFASPDTIKYTLYCYSPLTFTISTVIPNSTNGTYNILAPCIFNRLRFDLTWNNIGGTTFSYYRVITFPRTTSIFALDIYLVDAFHTDTVLTYLKPYDIFGIYTIQENAAIQLFEIFPTGTHLVSSDYIDAEGKMSATLMSGGQYIITVTADDATIKTLGPYYADTAGTKILRLFDVTLTGSSVDQQQVYTNTQVDHGNQTVTELYADNTASTTLLALSLYNNSCDTVNVFNTTPLITALYDNATLAAANYRATMTYNLLGNVSCADTTHPVNFCALFNRTDTTGASQTLSGTVPYTTCLTMPTVFSSQWTFPWIFILLLVVVALGANVRTAAPLSLIITLLAGLLYSWSWIGTGNIPGVLPSVALGLATLIAILFNYKRVS